MEWVVPQYSNNQIDKAGAILTRAKPWKEDWETENALTVINNHRSSHSFPLLTFRMGLSHRAKGIDSDVIIAQRIKRLSSVEAKLIRFRTMRLSHMQDIGGCRAVVRSTAMIGALCRSYTKSHIKHRLLRTDDYVGRPRDTGYRGVHLIYSYYSDRKATYNGLKIEVQIRTRLQHAWATAVETVDAFTGQALKGGGGKEDWRNFFSLMGTYIAREERTPSVPNTPETQQALKAALRRYARKLDVRNHLDSYRSALKSIEHDVSGAHYYLVELNADDWLLNVTSYTRGQLDKASEDYLSAEKRIAGKPGCDVVLVSVGSLAALRRAYPNYFADTHVFLKILADALA